MADGLCGMHILSGGSGGVLFQLLFVALFFMVVFWIFQDGRTKQYRISSGESAAEILAKRYASGEITKKQYIVMKKEIGA
ncbi:MAG: hypothetical protein KAJ91_05205 [Candidatus Aenigmarchaeota archaeon]|nr:hypothetical protein [Candidatus Aenigmarchaeota archaeon]